MRRRDLIRRRVLYRIDYYVRPNIACVKSIHNGSATCSALYLSLSWITFEILWHVFCKCIRASYPWIRSGTHASVYISGFQDLPQCHRRPVLLPSRNHLLRRHHFASMRFFHVTFILSMMFHEGLNISYVHEMDTYVSYVRKKDPYLLCSLRQTVKFYILRDEPVSLMFWEEDPSVTLLLLYDFFYPLEVLITSSRQFFAPSSSITTFPHAFPSWLKEVTPCAFARGWGEGG